MRRRRKPPLPITAPRRGADTHPERRDEKARLTATQIGPSLRVRSLRYDLINIDGPRHSRAGANVPREARLRHRDDVSRLARLTFAIIQ